MVEHAMQEDEIEVTPKMIKAGEEVVYDHRDVTPADALAKQVYLAMSRQNKLPMFLRYLEPFFFWNKVCIDTNEGSANPVTQKL